MSDITSAAPEPESRIRLALVDDHAVFVEGLARIFASENDVELVGTAGTIADAISMIDRAAPTVILMDFALPDGDGASATGQILRRRKDVKIVMLSGSEQPDTLTRAFEAGCVGFLSKARPWSEVVDAVRAASRGASVMRADELAELLERLRRPPAGQAQWLSPREIEILKLLARGRPTDRMAAELFIAPNTLRNHVSSILSKLGAHSKLEAVAIAVRDGVISIEQFQ
jgi:DNA-binding NarL/FixJ family response regulator